MTKNNEQITIDKDKFAEAENEPINQEAVNKFIEETDKFYVDGVDVSGCCFYHSETGTECHIALAFAEEYIDDNHTYFKCEQNPNCYYKQLKAKEQECEGWKQTLDGFLQNNLTLRKTLAEIKEIAEFACEKSICDGKHCDYCSDGRIIKIINEVEDVSSDS